MAVPKMADKMKAFSAKKQKAKAAKAKKGGRAGAVPVTIVPSQDDSMPSDYEKERAAEKKAHGGFDKHKVEDACRTLEQAAEIMADKKLMSAVGAYHAKKSSKVTSILALKQKASAAAASDAGEESGEMGT